MSLIDSFTAIEAEGVLEHQHGGALGMNAWVWKDNENNRALEAEERQKPRPEPA